MSRTETEPSVTLLSLNLRVLWVEVVVPSARFGSSRNSTKGSGEDILEGKLECKPFIPFTWVGWT